MQPVMIVTGGSQGIGAAIARLAGARGYAVALTYQSSRSRAETVAAEITAAGGRAIAVQAEMADEASILALFRRVDAELGPVTALVNNAGTPGPAGKIDAITAAVLDEVLAVNVRAPFLLIREAVARMATDRGGKGGAIVRLIARGRTRRCERMDPVRRLERRTRQPDDRCIEGTGVARHPGERGQSRADPDGTPCPRRSARPTGETVAWRADGPRRDR
jgi:NAD(P)-dependent dehydrogenase (short-subunit alcohol dehydrogenase family)